MANFEYLERPPAAIPDGRILVHNHVYPVARAGGARGSRFWLEPPRDNREVCDCGWALELGEDYRAPNYRALFRAV